VRAANLELDNTTFLTLIAMWGLRFFGYTKLCFWMSCSSCFESWCLRNVGNRGPNDWALDEKSNVCRGVAEPSGVWDLRRHMLVVCFRPLGKSLDWLTVKMGPIGCLETSAMNYPCTPSKILKARRPRHSVASQGNWILSKNYVCNGRMLCL